ncbi:MAG: ankyrin repeat domain-containing protein [Herbinix sp.]|nr:ankyrin repeat domain-containing protein [Herbinix sp.]
MAFSSTTFLYTRHVDEKFKQIKFLLNNRAKNNLSEPSKKSTEGESNGDLLKILLGDEKNINIVDEQDMTYLDYAVYKSDLQMADFLLQQGAVIDYELVENKEPLIYVAARRKDVDMVKLLLAYGADPDARINDGSTALIIASQMENLDIVKELVKSGADINAVNKKNISAFYKVITKFDILHFNMYCGSDSSNDVLEFLLQNGVKPDTDLRNAEYNNDELYTFKDDDFLGNYMFSKYIDREKRALGLSCFYKDYNRALLLLKYGADPNYQENYMRTPLHYAVASGSLIMVELLIEHGADPDLYDIVGNKPADLALHLKHCNIYAYLSSL